MSDNGFVREIDNDISQLKHDFSAHHWLFAVAAILVLYAGSTFWRLNDFGDALTGAASIVKKQNADIEQLQVQLTSVRQDLADLRQSGGSQPAARPAPTSNEPTQTAAPPAPSTKRHR